MISSVVGFDIGYSSCYIAIARGGGIEIIDNEYSKRDNPTVVAYGRCSDGRKMGTSAQSQRSGNLRSTITGFKPLLGRQYDDPMIALNIKETFNDIIRCDDGSIGFKVDYENNKIILSPEHVTSSLLVYLKQVAQIKLGFAVNDCVVSVPLYFCDYQRRALIFAARSAGLNVLRLMNESTAVALAYGIYKQDLPAEQEKARLVVFVDVGDNDTQVSAVAFNKGKLEVKRSLADVNFGGRHFGARLFDYFQKEFLQKYKLDVTSQGKAMLRLQTECEKLKKTMSANNTPIPLNIECLMNDADVSSRIDRQMFEDVCTDLFDKLRHLLQELLHNAPFSIDDIDAVEIVGGASRMPMIKSIIAEVLRKPCSTTLNADEAVARGCALQCAILSPAFKVRDFAIHDIIQYGVKLVWYDPNGTVGGDMEVFTAGHQFPFSKMLTFYRKENLILEASYSTAVPHPQSVIGKFEISPLKAGEDGSSVKVKVKVKIDNHGTLTIESAHTVTKIIVVEEPKPDAAKDEKVEKTEEKMETEQTAPPETNGEAEEPVKAEKIEKADSEDKTPESELNGEKILPSEDDWKKKKTKVKTVPLNISASRPGFEVKLLQEAVERENNMVNNDKLVKDQQVAKNGVEEYVYDMRDKLYGRYEKYISPASKDTFSAFLNQTEDWLYDDGEACKKQVYIDKLAELKRSGDAVVRRYTEHEGRQSALNLLGTSLVHVRKVLDHISNKDELYDHFSDEDIATLTVKEAEYMEFFNDACNKNTNQKLHEDPSVTIAEITCKRKELDEKCNPIINKPKPKVEPPPVPAEEDPKETEKDAPMHEADQPAAEADQPAADQPTAEAADQPAEADQPAADQPPSQDATSMELD